MVIHNSGESIAFAQLAALSLLHTLQQCDDLLFQHSQSPFRMAPALRSSWLSELVLNAALVEELLKRSLELSTFVRPNVLKFYVRGCRHFEDKTL